VKYLLISHSDSCDSIFNLQQPCTGGL